MNNIDNTPVSNNKVRYALAKATNRIFARVIDACIVTILVGGIGLLLIATDPRGIKSVMNLEQTWRYFLISLSLVIISFSYFVLLPLLNKGRTIGFLLFKLRLCNLIQTKNFFLNIIKREFFLWMIFSFTSFIIGIVLLFKNSDEASTFLNDIMFWNSNSNSQTNIWAIIIDAFYGCGTFILLFVCVNLCINNKKRCFIDHISDTAVIKLIPIGSKDENDLKNKKVKSGKRNYRLPGEINSDSLQDEVDSLG